MMLKRTSSQNYSFIINIIQTLIVACVYFYHYLLLFYGITSSLPFSNSNHHQMIMMVVVLVTYYCALQVIINNIMFCYIVINHLYYYSLSLLFFKESFFKYSVTLITEKLPPQYDHTLRKLSERQHPYLAVSRYPLRHSNASRPATLIIVSPGRTSL